jgi:hypothetical protein
MLSNQSLRILWDRQILLKCYHQRENCIKFKIVKLYKKVKVWHTLIKLSDVCVFNQQSIPEYRKHSKNNNKNSNSKCKMVMIWTDASHTYTHKKDMKVVNWLKNPRCQPGHSHRPPDLCDPGTLPRGWRHPPLG